VLKRQIVELAIGAGVFLRIIQPAEVWILGAEIHGPKADRIAFLVSFRKLNGASSSGHGYSVVDGDLAIGLELFDERIDLTNAPIFIGLGPSSINFGGDWGMDEHDQSDGDLGIAEIGAAWAIGSSGLQLGDAIGSSWSDHDTRLGGNQESQGQYLLGELIFPIEVAGPGAWMTLTTYYHQSDAEILRAYDDGFGVDSSYGETDVDSWAFRARIDWENLFAFSGVECSPYVDLAFIDARVEGYTEEGGAAPAVFEPRSDHAFELRAGMNLLYEINESLAVTGEAGLVHQFSVRNSAVSGEVPGSAFSMTTPDSDDTWATASIGIRADTNAGIVNVRLHGTTEGSGPTAWASVLWSVPF